MRYFLMNNSYQWVEVSQSAYNNPPDDMINNKASLNSDAFVSLAVANVGLDSLAELFDLLQQCWRGIREEARFCSKPFCSWCGTPFPAKN